MSALLFVHDLTFVLIRRSDFCEKEVSLVRIIPFTSFCPHIATKYLKPVGNYLLLADTEY